MVCEKQELCVYGRQYCAHGKEHKLQESCMEVNIVCKCVCIKTFIDYIGEAIEESSNGQD